MSSSCAFISHWWIKSLESTCCYYTIPAGGETVSICKDTRLLSVFYMEDTCDTLTCADPLSLPQLPLV